jgi:hypothetical protein
MTDFNRVAERSESEQFNFLALEQPKLIESLHETVFSGDRHQRCPLARTKVGEQGHHDTGRTRICEHSPDRKHSLHPATSSKQGDPDWTTFKRLPCRIPISASRETHAAWPLISWTSAHSPARIISSGMSMMGQ